MTLFLAVQVHGSGTLPLEPCRVGQESPRAALRAGFHQGCEQRDKQGVIDTKPTEHFTIQKRGLCHYD